MGDAAGIGPEIVNKILSLKETYQFCRPVIIGDAHVLIEAQKVANTALKTCSIERVSEAKFDAETLNVIDLSNIKIEELKIGEPQAMTGRASFEYVKKAVQLALSGEIDAITTAPISKEAMMLAGLHYPGHTEILAELTNSKTFGMMFVAEPLKVILVSIHVSLKQAIDLVRKERILSTIKLAQRTMNEFGVANPRIAVAGLNPHAGEAKMFGSEDAEEIAPAVREAKDLGMNAVGPFPPDTIFYRGNRGEFDIIVAMYHDQGLIPIKLLGFERGVNVTVGLPIIRTSPDHGTGYDIARARSGTANPSSLLEAMKIASRLVYLRAT
jgi:4-hydroxythreonine-4-phosphate dehydrogenase